MDKDMKQLMLYYMLRDNFKYNTKSKLRYYLNENKISDIDLHKLYVDITNYRIKTYGTSAVEMFTRKEEQHKYILNSYKKGRR